MIHFLCIELKKIIVSEKFFKFNNYFLSTDTPTMNKVDDGMPVTYFSGLQVLVLKLQTNLMKVYW